MRRKSRKKKSRDIIEIDYKSWYILKKLKEGGNKEEDNEQGTLQSE